MKLLYAEDEAGLSEAVVDILTYHHYMVDAVYDGAAALAYAQSGQYDGIILDVMMPKLDGMEVLNRLRQSGDKTPVLLLTAKSEVEDKIRGLDLGADDYLPKPFAMGELLARVRAMLRRKENYTPDVLCCGALRLNRQNCTLCVGEKSVILPKLEYLLMETLMLNQQVYLSSETLLTKVWGYDTEAELGTLWVYLTYLRKRLAALDAPVSVRCRRGLGYRLEAEDD